MIGENEYLFKIYLLGDSGVGKTSLLRIFAGESFPDSFTPTIGVNFRIKPLTLDNNIIKLEIWDITDFDMFWTVFPFFNRGIYGLIFVYDVTNRESFDNLPRWLLEIDKIADRGIPRLLVGNKGDLVDQKVVDYSTSIEHAKSLNIPFLEASAKCATNVVQTFVTMASTLKSNYEYERDRVRICCPHFVCKFK